MAPQISLLSKGKLSPLVISGPDISIGNQEKEFTWTLAYDKTQTVVLSEEHINLVTTGDVTCTSKKLTQDGDVRKVTIGGCQGDGDVRFSVAAGSAVSLFKEEMDEVNSALPATVDNTPPMVVMLTRIPISSGNSDTVFEWTATYWGAEEIFLSLAKVQLTPISGASVNCDVEMEPSSLGENVKILRASQCNGDGRFKITIQGETAKDQAGNIILVSTDSEEITIDNIKPTISVAGPSPLYGNANKVFEWTVTYSGHDSLDLTSSAVNLNYSGSVSNCKKEIQTIDASTQKIRVSECDGDGSVQVKVAEGAAKDSSGNKTEEKDDLTAAVVDNTSPSISIGVVTPVQGNSSTDFSWVVTYSDASSVNLNASHVSLSGTSVAGGGCTTTVTNAVGVTQRTVKVSGCQGDGTLQISILPNTASDVAGNFAPGASSSSQAAVDNSVFIGTLQTTALTVNSLSLIPVTLSFAEAPQSSVLASHFNLLNATISGFTGSGTTYSFDLVPSSDGAVSVQLKAGVINNAASTANVASNALSFTVDRFAPSISIGTASILIGNSTKTFAWPVIYSGASDITLTSADVVLTGATTGCTTSVTGAGSSSRTVSVHGCTGNGTLKFSLKNGTAKDDAGNLAGAFSFSPSVTVDNTPPSLTVTGPTPNTGSQGTEFVWTLDYSGSDSISLDASHIILKGAGNIGCHKVITTNFTNQRKLTVSNCSGNGVLSFDVSAGSAKDAAGNIAAAKSSNGSATVTQVVITFLNPPTNGFGGLKGIPFSKDTQFWSGATSQTFKIYRVHGGGTVSFTPHPGPETLQGLLDYLADYPLTDGNTYYITTTGTIGGASQSGQTTTWTAKFCPDGYVRVPGPSSPTDDFCVAKYEMKNDSSVATSMAGGTPWTNVTRTGAINACKALNINGDESKFALISNDQWQIIAENISRKAVNWSGGGYLNGILRSGYTYGSPVSTPLSARSDDDSGCFWSAFENCNISYPERNRTHVLSNGSVIWDFSGNVWEWVSTPSIGQISGAGTGANTTDHDTMRINYLKTDYSPEESNLKGSHGIGEIYNAGGNEGDGVIRGGQLSDQNSAGIFAANINIDESSSPQNTGFRCVYNNNP